MRTFIRALVAYACPCALFLFLTSPSNPQAKLLGIFTGLVYGLVLATVVQYVFVRRFHFSYKVFLRLVPISGISGLFTGCLAFSIFGVGSNLYQDWEKLSAPPEKGVEIVAYARPPLGGNYDRDLFIKTSEGNIYYYHCVAAPAPTYCSMQWLKTDSIPQERLQLYGGSEENVRYICHDPNYQPSPPGKVISSLEILDHVGEIGCMKDYYVVTNDGNIWEYSIALDGYPLAWVAVWFVSGLVGLLIGLVAPLALVIMPRRADWKGSGEQESKPTGVDK